MGWFRPVHVKPMDAREQRTMLSARTTLMARLKDIENSVRELLRGFGLRLPRLLRGRWDAAVREAVAGHPSLLQILDRLLTARRVLREQLAVLDKRVRDTARIDRVCRRLMPTPGVGALVALTCRAAVDQPDHTAGGCDPDEERAPMFSHVMVGSNNIARSKKFYYALFVAIGAQPGVEVTTTVACFCSLLRRRRRSGKAKISTLATAPVSCTGAHTGVSTRPYAAGGVHRLS
jgi:hypothetical protein